jgi:endonuclease/exonuclease/phosphatase family metal-dependent hydrolase
MAAIKVASYNIRKSVGTDRRRQPERILRILNELDADIVALQEVDRRFGDRRTTLSPELIVDQTHLMPVGFGIRQTSLGWHGNAILVRKGIEVMSHHRIDLPAFEPRGAVLADFRHNGGVVRVVGMHLGLLGRWRERQALAVIGHLETLDGRHPTIIMGDLNQWNIDGGCLDPFALDHNIITPGPSFHSRRPMLQLDRIITSRDFTVRGTGVHRTPLAQTGSDHLPVWAVLEPLSAAEAA